MEPRSGGCEWAGFGFGWDGWAGKDLSQVLPYAAIEMHVRSKEGTMYGLPIVLTLEDYSGGMGFAYTDNKYFERTFIDEEWQKVVVPLSTFDMEVENLDPTNVKQLMFELQGSGSIYVDDVQLVYLRGAGAGAVARRGAPPGPDGAPHPALRRRVHQQQRLGPRDRRLPVHQSDVGEPVHGLDRAPPRVGPQHLERAIEASMGVSWDRWYPVDMTPVLTRAAIQLDVRLPSGTAERLPVRIGLEDYGRQFSAATLDGRYTPSGRFTSAWQTVTIPSRTARRDAPTGRCSRDRRRPPRTGGDVD